MWKYFQQKSTHGSWIQQQSVISILQRAPIPQVFRLLDLPRKSLQYNNVFTFEPLHLFCQYYIWVCGRFWLCANPTLGHYWTMNDIDSALYFLLAEFKSLSLKHTQFVWGFNTICWFQFGFCGITQCNCQCFICHIYSIVLNCVFCGFPLSKAAYFPSWHCML